MRKGLFAATIGAMALLTPLFASEPDTRRRQKELEVARGEAKKQGIEFPKGWFFVPIRPGTFTMGSPSTETDRSKDENAHEVTLTKTFWMSAYETTQAKYEEIVGTNPSMFKGPQRPVEQVGLDDAQGFIRKFNERERQAGHLPKGWQYRLPTEAEWEYACRAGTETAYCFGNGAESLVDYAWYDENSGGQTHDVGKKRPNAWGLYDMHGNVCEWCQDWYKDSYSSGKQTDPTGAVGGSHTVARGGSWLNSSGSCRSASRSAGAAWIGLNLLGFRLVLAPK